VKRGRNITIVLVSHFDFIALFWKVFLC
jgi:hypothetical protein